MPYLQLKLGALTVRFEGYIFEDGDLPKTPDPDQYGTASYSGEGGLSVDGSSSLAKNLWTFSVTTDVIRQQQPDLPDQVRELEALYQSLRTTAGSDPQMELEDTSQYFFDVGSRTRALATGASEIATITGVKYYPKYYAIFARPVEYQRGEGFTIQLAEGDIFSA